MSEDIADSFSKKLEKQIYYSTEQGVECLVKYLGNKYPQSIVAQVTEETNKVQDIKQDRIKKFRSYRKSSFVREIRHWRSRFNYHHASCQEVWKANNKKNIRWYS